MGSRRKGREAALQMLYQMDISEVAAEDAVRTYWSHLGNASREGEEFANAIVRGAGAEGERIDALIRKVSHHWRLERMSRVDRNILRLAVVELIEMGDVPRRVTLNEAVELAKRYGSEGSAGFVNGVLDRIAAEIGKE
ncbi:MAG: transcription antitermination factor NusB [Myxococcota bacterium]